MPDDDQSTAAASAAPPPDPESGQAGMPNDPNAPDDGLKSQSLSGDDEYTQQLKQQHQKSVDRADHYHQEQQQYIDHFQKDAANQPAAPQLQQMPPMPQEQKGSMTKTVFNILAVAATAFALFGSRRNHGSQGALMGGLGALFKGISEGNQEKVKEDSVKWHQLNESILNENKERLQNYKDIMGNRKLDLQQQMSLIKMNAGFHKDQRLEDAADQKNLALVQKNLENKQKQITDHSKRTTGGVMPKQMEDDYRRRVLDMTKGKVDYSQDPQAANEVYPASQYYKDLAKEEGGKVKDKTKADEKATAADPVKSTAADPEKSDDPLDLGLTSPKMDTQTKESVLGGGVDTSW